MSRITINEQVAITKLGFKKDLSAYPRRMEFRGAVYDFLKLLNRQQFLRGAAYGFDFLEDRHCFFFRSFRADFLEPDAD